MSSGRIPEQTGRLRASRLAELAGVSIPTIKHYLNEGLIPEPLKTGRTMAYYDPACIERIKLIKRLQKEQFLPLEVIKRVLDSGSAYEEELQMGRAMLKSPKPTQRDKPLSEHAVERRTGYPLRKIRLLEREGLLMPQEKEGGRQYDAVDVRVIQIMKRREELGVPFDHSVETLKQYRDALGKAVNHDIRLFAKNLLGEFPSAQTVKFLTEVDDSLDTFIVLIRQKMLRILSGEALKQMNDLPGRLAMLSFFPIKGKFLSAEATEQTGLRVFSLLSTGAFESAGHLIERLPDEKISAYSPAAIIAHALRGDVESALRLLDRYIPRPARDAFADAAAALAYMTSVGATSGFSGPTHLVRKALAHLKEIEAAQDRQSLWTLLARYVCGAIYVMLPDLFDTAASGIHMLEEVDGHLRARDISMSGIPSWVAGTLRFEIFPAAEVRVNRFLAEAYLKQTDRGAARKHIMRIIELAEPHDEHSKWARVMKLEIKH